jgi:HPt (histidine-containing phosphotransfer) domain-containing protein
MGSELDDSVIRALCDALGDEGAVEIVELYLDALEPERARLDDALAGGDALAIRRSAHDLKATSGTVGAMQIADVLAKIERLAAAGNVRDLDPLVRSLTPRLMHVRTELERWLGATRGT